MDFVKMFLRGIPLAMGLVLTAASGVFVMGADGGGDNLIEALVLGVIGVPLLLASIVSITRAIENMDAH